MSLNRLTLVLNASYEAINVVSVRRALCMIIRQKARMEVDSGMVIHTGVGTMHVPSVIRLEEYRRVPRQTRSVTRKSILMRDRYTCQYCLARKDPKALTLDHVFPQSRGGEESWTNLVAACKTCNNRKGSQTPEEAGMKLARKPAPIGIHGKHRLIAETTDTRDWDRFLFYENTTPQAEVTQ